MLTTTTPESAKFTAPLLLIHGRWCTAAVWRPFAGYFAHLGWTCHAMTLRGHGEPQDPAVIARTDFTDYFEDVHLAIAACKAPPVLLGHDLGGLLALSCAAAGRAVVALAPVVPEAVTGNRRAAWGSRLAFWRSRLLLPSGSIAVDYFGQRVPGGTTPESRRLARQLAADDLPLPSSPGLPKLLIVGEADAVCPPHDAERLATRVGADCYKLEGIGHALPWDTGWEKRVVQIHRWLVQQLGESLLVPREEEEED